MKLLHYIKGERNGQEAHDIELKSFYDPFLSDSIDGYNTYAADGAEHARDVVDLEHEIIKRSFARRGNRLVLILVAAGVVCAAALVMLLASSGDRKDKPEPVAPKTEGNVAAVPAAVVEEEPVQPINEGTAAPVAGPVDVAAATVPSDRKTAAPGGNSDNSAAAEDSVAEVAASDEMLFGIAPAADLSVGKYYSRPKVGLKKFNEYVRRSRIMPEDGSRGDVTVSFRVNDFGRPSSIRIEESFIQDAGREAIRLVEGGPEWTPTGERVNVTIYFR